MSRSKHPSNSKSSAQVATLPMRRSNRKSLGTFQALDTESPRKAFPLTRPEHVRLAAAALYNRCLKLWGNENLNAHQARAIIAALALARQAIFDTTVERRIGSIEKRLGIETDVIPEPDPGPLA